MTAIDTRAEKSLTNASAALPALPTPPLTGALANNGGNVQTMALLVGSPALNTGSNALAVDASNRPLVYDARGLSFLRVFNGTVDIGAYEQEGDRLFANGFEAPP